MLYHRKQFKCVHDWQCNKSGHVVNPQVVLLLLLETALWHAIALHDFMSDSPGDLQFAAGSKIAVIEIVSEEWLKGRLDGEEGIFPTAFVEKQEDESVLKPQSLSTNVADTAKGTSQ